MAVPATTSFAELLAASGLISAGTVPELQAQFEQSSSDDFADFLVRQNLLTAWQAEKLQQGKHRSFFLGPYQLRAQLARGGMATVYAAEHLESGFHCALKVLSPVRADSASYLSRFFREASLTSDLFHPNIVRVFDMLKVSEGALDVYFIVMELLQGRDLYEIVKTDGPLPVRQAVDVVRQAAAGLNYAHSRGLVHRDVKPGNLFLTDSGTLKVVDLGLAAIENHHEASLTRIHDERVLGTADYLAPEQAVDSHRADSRADIYALGCTLSFMLTGEPPFCRGTLAERILAHQTKQPPDIRTLRPDVPDDLAGLLNRMMVKRRVRRVQSCCHLVEALEDWLDLHQDDSTFDHVAAVQWPQTESGGRRLKRIQPRRRRQVETPTAAVTNSDTQEVRECDVYQQFSERFATEPERQQFASFLQHLHASSESSLITDSSRRRLQKMIPQPSSSSR